MRWRRSCLWLAVSGVAVAASGVTAAGERAAATAAGDRIAVARAGAGIELISPDGRRVAVLTRRRGWEDTDPAWSPDGRSIAFVRTTDAYRSFRVYVMRADGSRVRRVTAGRFDGSPAWSPDGRWIAHESTTGLRIVRPDGTGARPVPTPDAAASYPAWTPDGRIAYAWHAEDSYDWPERCRRAGARCGWIFTSRLDGTQRRALVRGRDPRWSPDGRTVVFTLPDGGVATMPAQGGRTRRLGRGFQAEWSADGRRIVYTRAGTSPSRDGVWLMDRDGSGAHPIRPRASMPAWRP